MPERDGRPELGSSRNAQLSRAGAAEDYGRDADRTRPHQQERRSSWATAWATAWATSSQPASQQLKGRGCGKGTLWARAFPLCRNIPEPVGYVFYDPPTTPLCIYVTNLHNTTSGLRPRCPMLICIDMGIEVSLLHFLPIRCL
jgi:hypothetical protein